MKQIKTTNIILSIILLMISSASFAQFGTIKGLLKESTTKEPLPYVEIRLFKDTIEIAKASTDIEGKYLIKSVKAGKYNMKLSLVGYKQGIIRDIKILNDSITVVNHFLIPNLKKMIDENIDIYTESVIAMDREAAPARSTDDMGISLIKISSPEISSNEGKNLSGILTAGVLNDFSRWELWQDVAKGDLNKWQEYWKFKPLERYVIQVVTANGRVVTDCEVSLVNKDKKTEWTARTDNTGKAELWANLFSDNSNKKGYSINIEYKGKDYTITKILQFSNGINIITLPASCERPRKADIMFVVDATGSMSDEIQYLQSELNNIILEVKNQNPDLDLNLGSVFYRDSGDAFVTRKSDFSKDINSTINFIKQQAASGGGDEPEAVHTALNVAINGMNWSDNAVARLLFLVLDAPPHYTPQIIDSIQILIKEAAAKGIRIIPITGSGIDKSAEYLMRAFALATNGTYVFLTDHSKVGNPHIKPTTDEYDVELLKDVLLRLFFHYLFIPSCTERLDLSDQQIRDTMYVHNPDIIAHEIADSSLVGKYNNQIIHIDTNKVSFVNQTQIIDLDKLNKDTNAIVIDMNIPSFTNFKYYPNPTTGKLTIEIKGKINELYLADISGKLLERYPLRESDFLEINIAKYPVGVYFLQYFLQNKWLTGKVVLTH